MNFNDVPGPINAKPKKTKRRKKYLHYIFLIERNDVAIR